MQLVWLVSLWKLLVNLNIKLFVVSCVTSKELLNADLCTNPDLWKSLDLIYMWQVLAMMIGLVVILIVGTPLVIVPLLVAILLLSIVKNKMLLLVPVLKLSIELRLILILRCYGFNLSFTTWVVLFLFLCKCVVTIKLLSLLLTIPCSMNIRNIVVCIVTSFRIY